MAEQQTANKRGDVAAAVQTLGRGEAGQGQTDYRNLFPYIGEPVVLCAYGNHFDSHQRHHHRHAHANTYFPGYQRQSQHTSAVIATGTRRQGQKYQEHGDAYTIVEPALHVKALPDPRRDGLVGHNTLAESRIGGSEHSGENTYLKKRNIGENHHSDAGAEGNTEWQADQQHAQWNSRMGPQDRQVCICRVDEKHQCKRQISNNAQFERFNIDVEESQAERSCD